MNGRHEHHEDEQGRVRISRDQFAVLQLELRGIRRGLNRIALAIIHGNQGDENALIDLAVKLHASSENLQDAINANKQ